MKKIFLCLMILSITALQQSFAQEFPMNRKHQLYLFGAADYYLNQFNVQSSGITTERIYNTPGFKGGLSYNLRLSKKAKSFFVADISYGRQYNKAGIYYNFNAFYNRTDIPESKLVPFKRKFYKDYLGLFVGYEHRFSIPKTSMELLLGGKVGAFASYKDYGLLGYYTLETDTINPVFSLYAFNRKVYNKGISSISGQINLGIRFYLFKTFDCKAIFSYCNTINKLTSEGEFFTFYRSTGEIMGNSTYFNTMHHLSLGFSISIPTRKLQKI
jgi:hypothetical protein